MFLRRCLTIFLLSFLSASPLAAQTSQDNLLQRYHQALLNLNSPTERRFSQEIQISGWQEAITTGEFSFRSDSTWEGNLTEEDRLYHIQSDRFHLISESDRLALYTAYVERPDQVAPQASIDLDATPETYEILSKELTELRGLKVMRLRLKPKTEGQLRELWLDPDTALPRRAVLSLAGVWGIATYTVDFRGYGTYWLPDRSRMQIIMNFWVPVGFAQRSFAGKLDIGSQFTNYRFGNEAQLPLPAIPSSPVETVRPDTESGKLGKSLSVTISKQNSRSPLAEKIAQFNLNKPDLSDPRTHINVFSTLHMGHQDLLIYLFRFDSKQTLVPFEPANSQGDSFKLFGTN
jgi:hypothetical protein